MSTANSFRNQPDERGRFGDYGGRFVAETLMPLVLELEREYRAAQADPAFTEQFEDLLEHYVGRPSPLYFAPRLTEELGGAQVWFKRDELNHTGAHKINNCIGQILLAMRMGKTRIIAETGAGQHGVATATVCARFGLPCVIYMGATDVARQQPNVFRMKLLGAEVIPVTSGAATLKDAMNEGLRDWVANVHDTFYIIGTAAGPHPYPELVRDFQTVIGREARAQMLARTGRLPDLLVAAIGGGSNAIGLFHPFLDDSSVRMLGVEAAGHGLDKQHASSTATRPTCCRTTTARSPRPTRSARGSTTPASVPSTLGSRTSAGSITPRSPTARRFRRSSCSAAPKGSSPRSSRATPSPRSPRSRRR
jgi:tryptophan synthase beta chain